MTEIVAEVGIGVKSEMDSRGQRTEHRGMRTENRGLRTED